MIAPGSKIFPACRALQSELRIFYRIWALEPPGALQQQRRLFGFEYEIEETPLLLQSTWRFQGPDPVKDAKFTLQRPAGWEYLASWRNHAEIRRTASVGNQWLWTV